MQKWGQSLGGIREEESAKGETGQGGQEESREPGKTFPKPPMFWLKANFKGLGRRKKKKKIHKGYRVAIEKKYRKKREGSEGEEN